MSSPLRVRRMARISSTLSKTIFLSISCNSLTLTRLPLNPFWYRNNIWSICKRCIRRIRSKSQRNRIQGKTRLRINSQSLKSNMTSYSKSMIILKSQWKIKSLKWFLKKLRPKKDIFSQRFRKILNDLSLIIEW